MVTLERNIHITSNTVRNTPPEHVFIFLIHYNKTPETNKILCIMFVNYCSSQPIRCTVIFPLEVLEKNNDECILILVIYWKKTGLLHTKISSHNIIYSS